MLDGTKAQPLLRALQEQVDGYQFDEALPTLDEVERLLSAEFNQMSS